MKKNVLLPVSLVGALVALSGCSQSTAPQPSQSPQPSPQVVLASPDPSGVSVTGRGEASAAPDIAFFDVGVDFDAPSVGAARNGAAKAAERVVGALKKNGVEAKDLQTSSLSISPRYDHTGGRERIVGYTVSTSVTVKAKNLDALGKLVDEATDAGGNATRVSGIRFGFDDPTRLRDGARERAVADARRRADELARLSGIKLGKPITIEEIQVSQSAPPTVTLEGADATRMPIERGTGSVAVEVRVRWGIGA